MLIFRDINGISFNPQIAVAPAKPVVPKEPQAAAAAVADTAAEVVTEAEDDDDVIPIFG